MVTVKCALCRAPLVPREYDRGEGLCPSCFRQAQQFQPPPVATRWRSPAGSVWEVVVYCNGLAGVRRVADGPTPDADRTFWFLPAMFAVMPPVATAPRPKPGRE